MPNELEENLRLIYEQAAEHHRYFLSWRQNLLTGYFVAVATLTYASINSKDQLSVAPPFVLLTITFLSITFLALERRNWVLYTICQNAGKEIESTMSLKPAAGNEVSKKEVSKKVLLFSKLIDSGQNVNISHSFIIEKLYSAGAILSSVLAGIVLYCSTEKASGYVQFIFWTCIVLLIVYGVWTLLQMKKCKLSVD